MEDENELILTDKEENYCQAYIICLKQITAYRMAFDAEAMNENSAAVEACRLHASPKIALRIKQLQQEAYERNKITVDEIVNKMAGMVRFDLADLYDNNGTLKSIHDIPVEARMMITELNVYEEYQNAGGGQKELIGFTKKVKTIDKLVAIEKLMKHLGGYEVDNSQKNKMILDTSTLSTEELKERAEAIRAINGKA